MVYPSGDRSGKNTGYLRHRLLGDAPLARKLMHSALMAAWRGNGMLNGTDQPCKFLKRSGET